jgi:hypothetical protein
MKELEKLIMALHKNNYNLQRFSPPEIEPPVLNGEEKHLAFAGNPTPAAQPIARRDATDTGVIRLECTPLHIYFSLDFCLKLLHLCVPAPNNLVLLQFGLYLSFMPRPFNPRRKSPRYFVFDYY